MTEPGAQPNHDTRFQKGQSGNPVGPPRGSRNRVTRLMETLLQGEAETLMRVAIGRAMAVDPVALKPCLERMMAPMRGQPSRSTCLPAMGRSPRPAADGAGGS